MGTPGPPARLPVVTTPRERDVAARLAAGESPRVVARTLGLRVTTVQFHVRRLAAKLPGTLPAVARIVVWWRGGTREILG